MKKILSLLALVLSLAAPTLGQQVNSDQVKKKTDGGLAGDASKSLAVAVARSATPPGTPVTGQLWCDTTATPCTLKQWSGAAWVAPIVNAALVTQADLSSLPGSPVDGQVFLSKAPRAICMYDATAVGWYCSQLGWAQQGANIQDVYTAPVIPPPTGAIAATISGTAGSTGAGTYSWRITCRNASGGETPGGATSNVVTPGTSKSADLASIPLCTTGAWPAPTNRSIGRTKTGQGATGPWYYVGTIPDNTTTTFHDGAADGLGLLPDINFSAVLPGSWIVANLAATGGCGGTGRATMACYNGVNTTASMAGLTTDPAMRASLSIVAYSGGNYTIQYRVKQLSQNGDTFLPVKDASFFGTRYGTADNAQRFFLTAGNAYQLPFSVTAHGAFSTSERTTIGGAAGGIGTRNQPYPEIDAFPFWVRVVKRGVTANVYLSSDSVNWTPLFTSQAADSTNAAASVSATFGAVGNDHLEVPFSYSGTGQVAGQGPFVEWDQFTLTVN